MNIIASAGSALLERSAVAGWASAVRSARPSGPDVAAQPESAPTRVTLGGAAASELVYTKPSPKAPQALRLWAGNTRDEISGLMARNSASTGAATLAERWRGLGGALLARLAESQAPYKQTLAEGPAIPGAEASATAGTEAAADPEALRQQALSGVATQAATVAFKVQTRSGQTLELSIAVNDGSQGGTRGLEVQLKSTGPLDQAEQAALADLSDGLDRALEGLGREPPKLDLAGLTHLDSRAFTSLELKVEDPRGQRSDAAPGALGSFVLQLGADRKSLSMKSGQGELALSVDAASPLAQGGAAQRRSAIDRVLKQIDAAAERGHADEQLAALFKDGFRQLQAPPAEPQPAAPERPDRLSSAAASSPLKDQVDALRSGLADFEASFSGASAKLNRYGGIKEQGHAAYALSQQSRSKPRTAGGGETITETLSEKLSASYLRTRTLLLDPGGGNYDATRVQDEKTVTTHIETARNQVERALRKTDEQSRLSFDSLEKHRVIAHHETPQSRSFVERLR